MIVTACLGMATKYAKAALAIRDSKRIKARKILGGRYYIEEEWEGSGHGWQRLSQYLQ